MLRLPPRSPSPPPPPPSVWVQILQLAEEIEEKIAQVEAALELEELITPALPAGPSWGSSSVPRCVPGGQGCTRKGGGTAPPPPFEGAHLTPSQCPTDAKC